MDRVRALVRDVPDFPKPGIVFKDLTPALADGDAFREIVAGLVGLARGRACDKVVAVEARGFLFGAAVASALGVGLVPVRKPGKLPWKTDRVTYALEYGTDSLEMHVDALRRGDKVLVVDDLLATGGTAAAASQLVERQGASVEGFAFVIELDFLQGRQRLGAERVHALLHY